MHLLDRFVSGGGSRRSRLHDEKGNRVDLKGLAYAPRALGGALLRLAFNWRPALPWISYRAIADLNRIVDRDSVVAEFGSGMSTVWLARRARTVVSHEDCPAWHDKVVGILARHGLGNVELSLHTDPLRYASLDDVPGRQFDLILVDGSVRDRCMRTALARVRPGGVVYLDNSDKESDPARPRDLGVRDAEELLLEHARTRGGHLTYYVDFAPAQLFVSQGVAWRTPAAAVTGTG